VRPKGALAALLSPIGTALGVVIVAVTLAGGWNIYSASEARRLAHEQIVKPSGTHLETTIRRQIRDDQTEFVLKLADGKLLRVTAGKAETSAFLAATETYLDAARGRAEKQAASDLDRVFATAFATRDADLNAYADWFFAWGRSWRFLYEAGAGAVQEMARLFFSRTQVSDAARNAAEDYLLRNYTDLVLKPAERDGQVTSGLRQALADAHEQYLVTVAGLDARVQQFLAEKTDHLEEIPAGAVNVTVDWDAEKWKAPLYRAEDRFLRRRVLIAAKCAGASPRTPSASLRPATSDKCR
jgi:hypothetical protein